MFLKRFLEQVVGRERLFFWWPNKKSAELINSATFLKYDEHILNIV
jgi:hypothetical protein